jgi:hypothetical protein
LNENVLHVPGTDLVARNVEWNQLGSSHSSGGVGRREEGGNNKQINEKERITL